MNLPEGSDAGTITNPKDDELVRYLMNFCGAIEITTSTGKGMIVVKNGKLVSAYLRDGETVYRGKPALTFFMGTGRQTGADYAFRLKTYTDAEYADAMKVSRDQGLLLSAPPKQDEGGTGEEIGGPRLLDEGTLNKILSQPGVIAVSAFFEGFPVQSIGDADFEHVAASAEDLMRAGAKIAEEMGIGSLDQLILETGSNKFIIAPCCDLYLCIFTSADAQLGLIRVLLKSIQSGIDG